MLIIIQFLYFIIIITMMFMVMVIKIMDIINILTLDIKAIIFSVIGSLFGFSIGVLFTLTLSC